MADPTERPSGMPAFAGIVSRERWSPERVALTLADTVYGWFPFLEDFPLVIVFGSGAGLIWLLAQLPLFGFLALGAVLLVSWTGWVDVETLVNLACGIQIVVFLVGLAIIAPVSYALDNYFKELRGQRRDRR